MTEVDAPIKASKCKMALDRTFLSGTFYQFKCVTTEKDHDHITSNLRRSGWCWIYKEDFWAKVDHD